MIIHYFLFTRFCVHTTKANVTKKKVGFHIVQPSRQNHIDCIRPLSFISLSPLGVSMTDD